MHNILNHIEFNATRCMMMMERIEMMEKILTWAQHGKHECNVGTHTNGETHSEGCEGGHGYRGDDAVPECMLLYVYCCYTINEDKQQTKQKGCKTAPGTTPCWTAEDPEHLAVESPPVKTETKSQVKVETILISQLYVFCNTVSLSSLPPHQNSDSPCLFRTQLLNLYVETHF